jgi:hypothetical protein
MASMSTGYIANSVFCVRTRVVRHNFVSYPSSAFNDVAII